MPRGKRISTWMAEFGEMPPSKWPSKKKLEKMPANASIALARVKKSATEEGIRDTELVLDRTEGAVQPEPSLPMLSQIAAAILALKAAGVDVRKPEPIPVERIPPAQIRAETPAEEEDEDEDAARTKRFRRGRA